MAVMSSKRWAGLCKIESEDEADGALREERMEAFDASCGQRIMMLLSVERKRTLERDQAMLKQRRKWNHVMQSIEGWEVKRKELFTCSNTTTRVIRYLIDVGLLGNQLTDQCLDRNFSWDFFIFIFFKKLTSSVLVKFLVNFNFP